MGFFDGACYERKCACGAFIVMDPGKFFHFWWEGGHGTNNRTEVMTLWGALIAEKWLGLESLQVYGDAKGII